MKNKLGSAKRLNAQRFWRHVKSTTTQNKFSRTVIASYVLQIGSVFLSLILSILLARLLDLSEFGDYTYALNWILVLTSLATLGMDKLAVRSVASYASKEQWAMVKGLIRWSTIIVLSFSLFIMVAVFLVRRIFIADPTSTKTVTLSVALLLLPLLSLTRVQQGTLRGLHHIVKGQLAETILRPLLLIFILLLGLITIGRMTAPLAMGFHVVAALISLGIIAFLVFHVIRPEVKNLLPAYAGRIWLTIAIPLLFSEMLDEINQRASILMLGNMLNTEVVGVYNVAKRLAEPTIFVLIAVNVTLAPRVASYYSNNRHDELQSMITRSTRFALLASGIVALAILVLGPWLLLLWGPEFRPGYSVVLILTLGQVVQAAIGPVVLLLNMTGHERNVVVGLAVSTTLNLILNYLLIPQFGINGAAIATVTGILTWNILLAFRVRKLLQIDPSIIGQFLRVNSGGR